MDKEQLYDIWFKDVKLNTSTPPMNEKDADKYIGSCIMNHGYKPEKRPHNKKGERNGS